ncbi:MAG: 1-acyl-sn-glycerol-3-phosphate acyltransferase, partial [Ruminococcaceae bacterium]|nr:1-acyl-sn-glycerol-3-phosphate acyltransferase [Oscillospiraceae bacterium]
MKNKKKRNPYDVHKTDPVLYWLAVHVIKLWFRLFFGLKINNEGVKGIKTPFLLLANHESNYDFLMDAVALYPNKLHIMVTSYFFHHSLLGWLLRHMGCIPKKQFVPDTGAIKSVLRLIERGENVCIFPEGQTCYTGETSDFDESTAKLVKKLGVTVAASTVRGNHLAFPKWAPHK